ncbi:MAG: hypothetical protein ACI4B5_02380 [Bacteroidaceae bacterium]
MQPRSQTFAGKGTPFWLIPGEGLSGEQIWVEQIGQIAFKEGNQNDRVIRDLELFHMVASSACQLHHMNVKKGGQMDDTPKKKTKFAKESKQQEQGQREKRPI